MSKNKMILVSTTDSLMSYRLEVVETTETGYSTRSYRRYIPRFGTGRAENPDMERVTTAVVNLAQRVPDAQIVYTQAVRHLPTVFRTGIAWAPFGEIGSHNAVLVGHSGDACKLVNDHCILHSPSDHALRGRPMMFRGDKNGLIERTCVHGCGHPDPDSLAFLLSFPEVDSGIDLHGCDGCCGGGD